MPLALRKISADDPRGILMRRLLTSAAIATALLIPASMATVGLAGTANAAGSSISCTSLKGTISGTVTIEKCTPVPTSKATAKLYKKASGTSASLATGGNITWNGGAVTTIGDATVTSGGALCSSKDTEYTFTGTV